MIKHEASVTVVALQEPMIKDEFEKDEDKANWYRHGIDCEPYGETKMSSEASVAGNRKTEIPPPKFFDGKEHIPVVSHYCWSATMP